jgi:hypothetical protein
MDVGAPGDAPAEPVSGAWHVSVRFSHDVFRNGMDPLAFIRYLGTLGDIEHVATVDDAIPQQPEFDAESCYLGFEIRLATSASRRSRQATNASGGAATAASQQAITSAANVLVHAAFRRRRGVLPAAMPIPCQVSPESAVATQCPVFPGCSSLASPGPACYRPGPIEVRHRRRTGPATTVMTRSSSSAPLPLRPCDPERVHRGRGAGLICATADVRPKRLAADHLVHRWRCRPEGDVSVG